MKSGSVTSQKPGSKRLRDPIHHPAITRRTAGSIVGLKTGPGALSQKAIHLAGLHLAELTLRRRFAARVEQLLSLSCGTPVLSIHATPSPISRSHPTTSASLRAKTPSAHAKTASEASMTSPTPTPDRPTGPRTRANRANRARKASHTTRADMGSFFQKSKSNLGPAPDAPPPIAPHQRCTVLQRRALWRTHSCVPRSHSCEGENRV